MSIHAPHSLAPVPAMFDTAGIDRDFDEENLAGLTDQEGKVWQDEVGGSPVLS